MTKTEAITQGRNHIARVCRVESVAEDNNFVREYCYLADGGQVVRYVVIRTEHRTQYLMPVKLPLKFGEHWVDWQPY